MGIAPHASRHRYALAQRERVLCKERGRRERIVESCHVARVIPVSLERGTDQPRRSATRERQHRLVEQRALVVALDRCAKLMAMPQARGRPAHGQGVALTYRYDDYKAAV